jgi:hypothetical protein
MEENGSQKIEGEKISTSKKNIVYKFTKWPVRRKAFRASGLGSKRPKETSMSEKSGAKLVIFGLALSGQ